MAGSDGDCWGGYWPALARMADMMILSQDDSRNVGSRKSIDIHE